MLGYPVHLRDELYRAFLSCLESPDAKASFARLLAAHPAQGAYIADRIARYEEVLADWGGHAAKPPVERDVALGGLLFEHGLYFDCHEYLETAWRAAAGPLKTALQGIIQVAAGFHKRELDPRPEAGLELLEKGSEKLSLHEAALPPAAGAERYLDAARDAIKLIRSAR